MIFFKKILLISFFLFAGCHVDNKSKADKQNISDELMQKIHLADLNNQPVHLEEYKAKQFLLIFGPPVQTLR